MAVTRARAQASGLAARLRELGARAIEAPAIRIAPLDGPAPELERYDLVCLTSPNGARLLFERLAAAGRDARAFAGVRVAAIGPGTAAALREHGLIADVVPERFVAEGLVEALADVPVSRALVARAAEARDVLPDALRERGAEVDVLALYETVAEPLSAAQLDGVTGADYVTFTSSSTVRFFFDAVGDGLSPRTRLASIGPVTSDALRERGREPDVEAERHDIDGLVDALVADAAGRARPDGAEPRRRDERAVHHLPVRLRPGRRLRRRLPRRDRDDLPAGAGDRPHPRRAAPRRAGRGDPAAPTRSPTCPTGVHLAVVDPDVGAERRAVALRLGDGRMLVGPDNGLLAPAAERGGGIVEAVDIARSPFRLEPVSATFHGRDIFAPVAAHLAAGVPLAEAGDPLDPAELVALELPRRGTWTGRWWRTSATSTASATCSSMPATRTWPARV